MGILTKLYGGVAGASSDTGESVFVNPEMFGTQLCQYRGKPILVANTATQCGLAGQYSALEALHQQYGAQGLVVLGFPSNDFLEQEPGTDAEIASVCQLNHGVTFSLLPKAAVKGPDTQPLFKFLTKSGPRELRGPVRWNFEKFLIDRKGFLVGRWRSYVSPRSKSLVRAIERTLASEA